jgi:CRISPR-associated exonuclease Cas4
MSSVLMALAALALLIWWFLRDRAKVLPGEEVVYRDMPEARTLVSHRYRLKGRPDYVARQKRKLVPVEVKSRKNTTGQSYPGERDQVLAYCLLVEGALGGTVSHGQLQYANGRVDVPFGPREREHIVALLEYMDDVQEPHRSHNQAARCRKCGFRDQCSEALA